MATGTLGTTGTTSLISINGWTPATAIADIATISSHILHQGNPAHPIMPGAFLGGQVYLPGGRGIIQLKPGDYIAYDSFGWPIVVSKESIAAGGTSWAHS